MKELAHGAHHLVLVHGLGEEGRLWQDLDAEVDGVRVLGFEDLLGLLLLRRRKINHPHRDLGVGRDVAPVACEMLGNLSGRSGVEGVDFGLIRGRVGVDQGSIWGQPGGNCTCFS